MAPRDTPLETADPAAGADASAAASFERMLVPVDFSSASRAAFVLAMRMAQRWGSEVVLFHVAGCDENDEFLERTGAAWGRGDVMDQALDHLRRFAEAVVPGSAERVVIDAERDDDPVKAVARACVRHSPSVVVLGTGAHDWPRWRRSRAERIVRKISCPVVLVRGEREVHMDADS
ncbi:MAG TPA: universal stress protein [Polyangiaceae bacterium]|nr:universal stress protein [Polyangiaceae bacterium]